MLNVNLYNFEENYFSGKSKLQLSILRKKLDQKVKKIVVRLNLQIMFISVLTDTTQTAKQGKRENYHRANVLRQKKHFTWSAPNILKTFPTSVGSMHLVISDLKNKLFEIQKVKGFGYILILYARVSLPKMTHRSFVTPIKLRI